MTETRRFHPVLAALFAAGVVFSAAAVGSAATFSSLGVWYAHLAKPPFTPPNWVFGPVWGLLYVLMTISFWRVLSAVAASRARRVAVALFLIQMALNALWSVVFFGMRLPLGGLVVIAAMLAAITATLIAFRNIDRPAAWLLTPYLAWVAFAGLLNGGVWWLNR